MDYPIKEGDIWFKRGEGFELEYILNQEGQTLLLLKSLDGTSQIMVTPKNLQIEFRPFDPKDLLKPF